MNVLIISEGPTDEYMLKPIIQAMMKAVGKPHAVVRYAPISKRQQGVEDVLKWERIQQILKTNPMVHLFLLCVDRDGKSGRKNQLDRLEKSAVKILPSKRLLLAENAWQEIEVWILAGQTDLPTDWKWQTVRLEPNAKEVYFAPYTQRQGLSTESPGGGRKTLAKKAAGHYDRIRQLCQEDILVLENRITHWLTDHVG